MGKRNKQRNKNRTSNMKVNLKSEVNAPAANSNKTNTNITNKASIEYSNTSDTLYQKPMQGTKILLPEMIPELKNKGLETLIATNSNKSTNLKTSKNVWMSEKERGSCEDLFRGCNLDEDTGYNKNSWIPPIRERGSCEDLFGVCDSDDTEYDENSWIPSIREKRLVDNLFGGNDSDEDTYSGHNIDSLRPSIREKKSFQNVSLGSDDENSLVPVNITTGAKPKITKGTSKKPSSDNENGLQINIEMNKTFGEHITKSVRSCEANWNKFRSLYTSWRVERSNTIWKLQELAKQVHEDQLSFNQTNVMFKEMNVGSRSLKLQNVSPTMDFLATFATFVTDAASGITSAAQAINADGFMDTFKVIMEHDAKVTKPLYVARSQCMEQYRGIEEVIRRFHSNTFGETIQSLNKTLRTGELWMQIKSAQEEGEPGKTIQCLDKYFTKNSPVDMMEKTCQSIQFKTLEAFILAIF